MADAPAAQTPPGFGPAHTGPITALQFIARLLDQTGAPGRAKTVDHVAAGDPTTSVTGIAVMAMASLDGLKQAAAGGHNLIVTHEPGFWSGNDDLDRLEGNALFLEKRDFIRANNLVVFNLHDHWRDRMPDGLAAGMAEALGWTPFQADKDHPALFRRAPMTLLELATELQTKLKDSALRVVGDPKLVVRTLAASWGNAAQMPAIELLNGPADAVVTGYTHEWEAVEYAQDMIATGQAKALILLGEIASVEFGMRACAGWIKTFVSEVPVGFIPAREGYWTVAG
jgi:putative NIF3 family GTP cyclohydrolase 1 type 2